jgi:hypothetical protein
MLEGRARMALLSSPQPPVRYPLTTHKMMVSVDADEGYDYDDVEHDR